MWINSYVCVSESKLKNMLKKLEETVCQMEGNRCIIVSKIYVHLTRIYQGAAKLTQKLKFTCEHIRFGKKPTEVNHCTWVKTKICSGRYHNDNIFKNIHSHQKKSQWNDAVNMWSCIYAFLMIFFLFIIKFRRRPFNI